MSILADTVDGVIGVDTHRDTLAAAALSPVGGVLAQTATSADATGYQQLLEFAGTQIPRDPARRCWAIQGAGSQGRRADRISAHPWRAGRRGRPADERPGRIAPNTGSTGVKPLRRVPWVCRAFAVVGCLAPGERAPVGQKRGNSRGIGGRRR